MRARLTAVALALAMAAAIFLLVWPIYPCLDGERIKNPTLLPVMFHAPVPVAPRRRTVRIVDTVTMGGFVLISGFSIDMFSLPGGIAMLLV